MPNSHNFVRQPQRRDACGGGLSRSMAIIDPLYNGTARLSDADGGEIVVGQPGIENGVAVVLEIGRLGAARCRLPAVEEKDEHGWSYFPLYPSFLAWAKSASALACSPLLE